MTPKISVITISYNNREGLEKTIQSVISQSYTDFEYLVIDGGSNDGSKEILEKYSEKITYWVSEPDKGIYNAMNKGITKAKGEYLIFINSGDELSEKNVLFQAASHLHTEDIITGNLRFISEDKESVGYGKEKISFLHLLKDTIWHPSTFIKRIAFDRTEMYDENLKICSDWKWFIHGILKHHLSYKKIDIIIANFYLDGLSSQDDSQKIINHERQQTLQSLFQFSDEDLEEIDQLLNDRKELQIIKEKIELMKKNRWIKMGEKLGFANILKYF